MRIRSEKNVLWLEPVGDLDLALCPELRETVFRAIDGGARHILFDLARTDFIDSSGLGLLLTIYKRVAPLGGTVRVERATPRVYKIFHLAGLDEILAIGVVAGEEKDVQRAR